MTAREVKRYLDRHMTRAARRTYRRRQQAGLIGESDAVLAVASASGAFPERPVLGAVEVRPVVPDPAPDDVPPAVLALSPEEGERRLGLSGGERRLVQMGLAAAGHDPGLADGMFGGKTRRALQAWQESKEVEATGYLTQQQGEVLAALGREEAQRLRVAAEQRAREEAERERKAKEAAEAARRARAEAERKAREEAEEVERLARKYPAGTTFRDCPGCPEMVVVPSGRFQMGSPSSEAGRDDNEGPVHAVTISRPFAVGVHEVTRGELARFVSATGRSMGDYSCFMNEAGVTEESSGRHWRNPGFRQTDDHPVVCVNWEDAQAYVQWLSRKTGEAYRLLSEAEWEYVARAGTKTARYWGESERGQCRYANGADRTVKRNLVKRNNWWYLRWTVVDCDDGHFHTAPVGSYEANGYKLHDVLGNVKEFTEDCWNDSYAGAPRDGSAWTSGDCSWRVVRGGSWDYSPRYLHSAHRTWAAPGYGRGDVGFRVARTLTP